MKGPASISYVQQYFHKAKIFCKFSLEFKGDVDNKIFEQAVDIVYHHNQILQYNLYECADTQNLQFVKNSEEFQKLLDQQKKIVQLNISDLQSELKYLHNESPEALKYGNECYLPIKVYILSGYKEREFTLFFIWDHIYFDGTNFNFQINEIFQIYSKLLKKQSIESHIKSLEGRYFLDDEQFLEEYFKPQVGFWQHFINTIRNVKVKCRDPAKLKWDNENDIRKFRSKQYQESFERNSNHMFQFSQVYDFQQIIKEVRKTYSQVSKNSILQAFIQRFYDFYAVNVRAKELNVDPESLRGLMSFGITSRNVQYEDYEKIAGNYQGRMNFTIDVRNFNSFEDLALANHNKTQKLKEQKQSISGQVSINKVLTDKQMMNQILKMNMKHTYASTSWTNIWLNNNVHMLEGAEFFRATQGVAYRVPDEPDHPQFFTSTNIFISNMLPQDDVSFTYLSMNDELNEKLYKWLQIFYEQFSQEYLKQQISEELQSNQGQN